MGTAFGIIGLIVGAIASIVTGVMTQQNVRETNKQNRELAAQQNQWQVEQIAQQNAYNSPANQVSRLLEAHINPALAMSNGAVNSGNQSDVARGVLPSMSSADLQPTGSSLAGLTEHGVQLAALHQQQPVTESLARLQDAQAVEKEIENVKKPELVQVEFENLVKQGDLVSKQISSLEQMTQDSHNETVQKINSLSQEMKESIERVNHMKEEERISKEQLEEVKRVNNELIKKMDAEIRKLAADKSLIEAQAGKIHGEIAKGNLELRARYGYTKDEIKATLTKEHESYLKELDEAIARARVRGNQEFQLMDAYTDLAGKLLSGFTSAAKSVSTFAK